MSSDAGQAMIGSPAGEARVLEHVLLQAERVLLDKRRLIFQQEARQAMSASAADWNIALGRLRFYESLISINLDLQRFLVDQDAQELMQLIEEEVEMLEARKEKIDE